MVEHEVGELWELANSLPVGQRRWTARVGVRWLAAQLPKGAPVTRETLDPMLGYLWRSLPRHEDKSHRDRVIMGLRSVGVNLTVDIWGIKFSIQEACHNSHLADMPIPPASACIALATLVACDGDFAWKGRDNGRLAQPRVRFTAARPCGAKAEHLTLLQQQLGFGRLNISKSPRGVQSTVLNFWGMLPVRLLQHVVGPHLTPLAAKRFDDLWAQQIGEENDEQL